ncbi:hypothetical protein D3C79_923870 [compost metagenome]
MRRGQQAANPGVRNHDNAPEALRAFGQHIDPLGKCLRTGYSCFSGYQLVGRVEQYAIRGKRFLQVFSHLLR